MTKVDHILLLETLSQMKGKFLLSGYASDLYAGYERKYFWNRHDFDLPNNASSAKSKERKTEIVWSNY